MTVLVIYFVLRSAPAERIVKIAADDLKRRKKWI
jgi:hypothetical protein